MKREAGVITVSTGSPSQIEHFGLCFRPSIEINAIGHRIGTGRRGCQGSKPPQIVMGARAVPVLSLQNLSRGVRGGLMTEEFGWNVFGVAVGGLRGVFSSLFLY